MNEYSQWAKELKKLHSKVLKGYSVKEVELIWRDYSNGLAASWLTHQGTNVESVKRVFDQYMIINHTDIWKKI